MELRPGVFPPHTFANDPLSFITPSWDALQLLTYQLAQQITASNQRFDRLITLAKGGWPMARSMVDFLALSEVASLGVRFYAGVNERLPEPIVYQDLPAHVGGERVLLFDDVADTGESLIFAKAYIERTVGVTVTTATPFYKPHSKVRPDFFAATTESWIIFPYEVFESMRIFHARWVKQGTATAEILTRFRQLGFPDAAVQDFAKEVEIV